MYKKLSQLLFFIMTFNSQANAQDIAIVCIGVGVDRTEALNDAFRSGISQAYGVYISTNTLVLNDSLIKDEIVQLSSGNIKSYEIISELQTKDQLYSISIRAIVSVDKLKLFSQQKGIEVDFKGGIFAANIKLQELNELNESKILENLETILYRIIPNSFDFNIDVGQPKITTVGLLNDNEKGYVTYSVGNMSFGKWELPFNVSVKTNSNIEEIYSFMINTLKGINMSESERINYFELNKKYFTVLIGTNNCSGTIRTFPNLLYYRDNGRPTGKYERGEFKLKLNSLESSNYWYVLKTDTVLFSTEFSSISKELVNYFDKNRHFGGTTQVLAYNPGCLNPIYNFRNKKTVLSLINIMQYLKSTFWRFTIFDGIKNIKGLDLYEKLTAYSYSRSLFRLTFPKDGFNPFVSADRHDYYGSVAKDLTHGNIFFSESDGYYQRRIKPLLMEDISHFEFPFNFLSNLEDEYKCKDSLVSKLPFIQLANFMYNFKNDYNNRGNVPGYHLVLDLSLLKKDIQLLSFSFFQFYTTDDLGKIDKFKIMSDASSIN